MLLSPLPYDAGETRKLGFRKHCSPAAQSAGDKKELIRQDEPAQARHNANYSRSRHIKKPKSLSGAKLCTTTPRLSRRGGSPTGRDERCPRFQNTEMLRSARLRSA